MNETLSPTPLETVGPAELLAKRVQQSLQIILAGLEERDGLTFDETEDLKRDLSMLLHRERMQIAGVEIDRSEQILAYMLHPAMDECLNLWFGKSEQTDQEIWNRFGVEVGLASRGDYDHWALDIEHPRLLVALMILLDQFPRNMYRETAKMYACDAHCRSLVKRGLRTGVAARLRPIERVFLCLALTHSEVLEDQHLCMHEWNQAMAALQPEDPLNAFHEIFHRHVAVIKRFGRFPHRNRLLQRTNTAAEEDFLGDNSFRFDLPLVRESGGAFVFAGAVQRRKVNLLGHEYETLLPDPEDAPRGGFEFNYAGPESVFSRAHHQLEKQGYIRIGDNVPDFTAETSLGPLSFYDFVGVAWCVPFSHPADFTPVCTTELGATARLETEWSKRGVKVVGLSVDSTADHEQWIADIKATQGAEVNFPIIADEDREVAMLFGMLDATHFRHGSNLGATQTVRNVFIISPSRRVELILSYPATVGRSFSEILRVIDALQLSAKYRVATPANWKPGDDTIVLPFIPDEEVERLSGDQSGFRKIRPYLRYVRDPSMRRL
jgi:thioredoxin-dependent peroxiredoxin